VVTKFFENLGLKVFEEKQEKSADGVWAKSLCDEKMHNSLPSTTSKKIFTPLDYKQS
jgi:hypothetical protein